MQENWSLWYDVSDTNLPMQSQKKVRSLKFLFEEVGGLFYQYNKTKVLISCAVTASFCIFVCTSAKSQSSHDAAQLCNALGHANKI